MESIEINKEQNNIGSDEKDNLIHQQQKKITSIDGTIQIKKSESLKTKADKAVANKADSNTSMQPVDIQK